MVVFGITVAWSIYTTGKKARQLIQKEKAQKQREEGNVVGPTVSDALAPAPEVEKSTHVEEYNGESNEEL